MNGRAKQQANESDCALELSEEMLEHVVGGIVVHRVYERHTHWGHEWHRWHHNHHHHCVKHPLADRGEGGLLDGLI